MVRIHWFISDGFWDSTLPRFILEQAIDPPRFHEIFTMDSMNTFWGEEVAVIIVPGQHSTEAYDRLNEKAKPYNKVVWIITGDEEGKFYPERLHHRNQLKWWFVPPIGRQPLLVDRVAPFGWTTDTHKHILQLWNSNSFLTLNRDLDFSFYGQMTHIRRMQCVEAVQKIPHYAHRGDLYLTDGFAKGVPQEHYFEAMLRSKLVLCPSGPCSPDTFRFAEALECGCIPVVDGLTPNPFYPRGYWDHVLGTDEKPFPIIHDWSTFPEIFEEWLVDWPEKSRRCHLWWGNFKAKLISQMKEDLKP